MTSEFARTVVDLIKNGHCDDDLNLIEATAQGRRLAISPVPTGWGRGGIVNDGGFLPGDRVITTEAIRPAYLQRRTGTLIRFKQKRWAFKPDEPSPWSRFLRDDGTCGVTPNMVRKETP